MEPVPYTLLSLLTLSGAPVNEQRIPQPDGSDNLIQSVPFPAAHIIAYGQIAGPGADARRIVIPVGTGECLAVTSIEPYYVDMSTSPTITIQSNAQTLIVDSAPLEALMNTPLLYLFAPGNAMTAQFIFTVDSVPGRLACARIIGYKIPQTALDVMRRMGTQLLLNV